MEDESWYSDEEFAEWSRIVLEAESEAEDKLSGQEDRGLVLRESDFERGCGEVWDEGRGGEGSEDQEED